MSLLFIDSISAQPLYVTVSSAQYTTYVDAIGDPDTTYPEITRTTTSSSPISDEIDQPLLYESLGGPITNHAIANAGLLEVSDQTGWGEANAEAISQIWFSPLGDQTQTLSIQIDAQGPQEPLSFTAGQISLLDLTANSELWNYSWNVKGPDLLVEVPSGDNVPWDSQYSPDANFSLDTDFLASDQYELTMIVCSNAGSDNEFAQAQLTGLQVVPEPSTVLLLTLCGTTLAILRRRK